jgi:hypothetical protein
MVSKEKAIVIITYYYHITNHKWICHKSHYRTKKLTVSGLILPSGLCRQLQIIFILPGQPLHQSPHKKVYTITSQGLSLVSLK